MRRPVLILLAAGLVLSCILASGCTTPSTPNATTPGTTPPAGGGGGGATLAVTAEDMAFNTSEIAVPAGADVTIAFTNNDAGVPHNIAVYTDSSASTTIFKGPIITGPATTTYTFTAPSTPGTYFFRCDPHPTTMTGRFVVR